MSSPRILVLQHSEHGGPGSVATCAEERGLPVAVVRLDRGESLPSLEGVSGLVVLGGPDEAGEGADWERPERHLIAEALRVGVRVLGICHGAQALARSQGGRTVTGTTTRVGMGRVAIPSWAVSDPLLGPEAPVMDCFWWYRDGVDLPAGALPLAGDETSGDLAFRIGRGWGLMFHVEVDKTLAEAWRPLLPEGTRIDGAALGEIGRRVIGRWLDRVEAAGR
jgi:GMP synthase (glutamine-hydrolysing)